MAEFALQLLLTSLSRMEVINTVVWGTIELSS